MLGADSLGPPIVPDAPPGGMLLPPPLLLLLSSELVSSHDASVGCLTMKTYVDASTQLPNPLSIR